MNRFKKTVDEVFKTSHLQRVRLKVDPALCKNGEISKYEGYEGYIISESNDNVKVYLRNGEFVTIPKALVIKI